MTTKNKQTAAAEANHRDQAHLLEFLNREVNRLEAENQSLRLKVRRLEESPDSDEIDCEECGGLGQTVGFEGQKKITFDCESCSGHR